MALAFSSSIMVADPQAGHVWGKATETVSLFSVVVAVVSGEGGC
jgi:hypothetical protein